MKIRTILILCTISFCYTQSWGQTWNLTKTMTATLEKNVLTVSTTLDAEKMSDYDWGEDIWHESISEIHSVIIEDGITDIFDWAFCHSPNIKTVTIAGSVEYIGGYAFYNCVSLESVQLHEGLLTLGHAAFKFCASLKSLDFPASITVIGGETGAGCIHLEAINVHPDNALFSSDNGILYNKDKTTLILYPEGKSSGTFEIPGTVKIIDGGAFYHASFEEISIPNSVEEIRGGAFATCNNLKTIKIPRSIKKIAEGIFGYCESLTAIEVDAGNADFASENGILYSKDKSKLHSFPPGKTGGFIIPSFVTSISDFAFSGCAGLTSITIPNTVTEIGGAAFLECTSLTSITIPYSVTMFGSYVLSVCTGLKEITVEWEKPLFIDLETFRNLDITDITLYVPTGTLQAYQDADIWQDFGTIVEYEYSGNEIINGDGSCPISAWAENGILHITGLKIGDPLNIFNLSGQLLYHSVTSAEDVQIPFPWRGVFIIISGKQHLKVIQ